MDSPVPDSPEGMDFGVLPRLMLMANPVLPELWKAAKCEALGFIPLPRFGDLRDISAVALAFHDIERGRELFELFKSWDRVSGSGEGLDISFIQNSSANAYTMLLQANGGELIARMCDDERKRDYALNIATLTVGKEFPLSGNFRWLRQMGTVKPILFFPALFCSNEMDLEAGILKRNVSFQDRETLSHESVEFLITRDDDSDEQIHHSPRPPENPAEIAQLRDAQLLRFFPVTATRLSFNPTFQTVLAELQGEFPRQRIVQAACNLTCKHRFPDAVAPNGKVDFAHVYEALRHESDPVESGLPLQFSFSSAALREQISKDAQYLCAYLVGPEQSEDPISELAALGVWETL